MATSGDWRIDKLAIENFRCFEHIELDFDPECTVLVGTNGSGKTAVLDALAIMLSTVIREFGGERRGFAKSDARESVSDLRSETSAAAMEPHYPVYAEIEAALAGQGYWWRRELRSATGRTSWADKNSPVGAHVADVWKSSDAEDDGSLLPAIALYGVERLIGVRRASGEITRSRASAYDSALDGKSDLQRLSKYIEALAFSVFLANEQGREAPAARAQLEAIRLACNTVLDGTGWRDPEWSPGAQEMALTHPDHGTLPLSFLSSGIKIAAGLVIDLVSRIARANPRHGAEELLRRAPGIVLIDEVDLHLHPTWQQRILPAIRSALPSIQFIVTTHSPQVLSTVDAESIRVLDGNAVHRVGFAAGLRSDVIMQRIMDTDPEPEMPINEQLDRYMDMVDKGQGRSQVAQSLRRHLDEELGGIANVPKLADADATIAFFDLDD